MNESYEALTVKQQDQIIGVNLNLDSLYKELDDGARIPQAEFYLIDLQNSLLNSIGVTPKLFLKSLVK